MTGARLARTPSLAGVSSQAPVNQTVNRTSNGSRCRGTNRRGEPCQRLASEPSGLCVVHAGAQNMAELGRRGGSVRPTTKLRQAADEDLREQARETLSRALAGEEVPKAALDAARSLFAYRPTEAPRKNEREGRYPDAGKFSFQQLVEAAAGARFFSNSGWLDVGTEQEMLEAVKSTRAQARGEGAATPGPPPAVKRAPKLHTGLLRVPRLKTPSRVPPNAPSQRAQANGRRRASWRARAPRHARAGRRGIGAGFERRDNASGRSPSGMNACSAGAIV